MQKSSDSKSEPELPAKWCKQPGKPNQEYNLAYQKPRPGRLRCTKAANRRSSRGVPCSGYHSERNLFSRAAGHWAIRDRPRYTTYFRQGPSPSDSTDRTVTHQSETARIYATARRLFRPATDRYLRLQGLRRTACDARQHAPRPRYRYKHIAPRQLVGVSTIPPTPISTAARGRRRRRQRNPPPPPPSRRTLRTVELLRRFRGASGQHHPIPASRRR